MLESNLGQGTGQKRQQEALAGNSPQSTVAKAVQCPLMGPKEQNTYTWDSADVERSSLQGQSAPALAPKKALLGKNRLNSQQTIPLGKSADNRSLERHVDSYFCKPEVLIKHVQQMQMAEKERYMVEGTPQSSTTNHVLTAEHLEPSGAALTSSYASMDFSSVPSFQHGAGAAQNGSKKGSALVDGPAVDYSLSATGHHQDGQKGASSTLHQSKSKEGTASAAASINEEQGQQGSAGVSVSGGFGPMHEQSAHGTSQPQESYHRRIATILAQAIFRQWMQRRTMHLLQGSPNMVETSESVFYHTAMLLIQNMVFAMRADGKIDRSEQLSVLDFCLGIFHDKIKNIRGELDLMLTIDLDPEVLARQVEFPEESIDLYFLAAVMLDSDHFLEQSYLENLAACLGIDPSLRQHLNERAMALVRNEEQATELNAANILRSARESAHS